jgi:membrane protease YdiL (CAAX protease family)
MNIYEVIVDITDFFVLPESAFALAGMVIFGNWLLKTSFGRKALLDSPIRRNNMPAYLPFIPLLVFFGVSDLGGRIIEMVTASIGGWQKILYQHIVIGVAGTGVIALIIFLAQRSFVRGLKGFGLDFRTMGRDLGAAIINFLSVWPVVMVLVIITVEAGRIFYGPDFRIKPHEELELLTEYSQLPVLLAVLFVSVVLAPVFEEMVFRGFFQTLFLSFTGRAWLSIAVSSSFFVMTHLNAGHWPGLFALSVAMGYSYEKSGSLFRPIFIHAFFNATSVAATWLQTTNIS